MGNSFKTGNIKIIRYFSMFFTVLQAGCFAGAYYLNDLSHKKVGVNHHVIYKKQQYMKTILNGDHIFQYQILVLLVLAAIAVYLIRHHGRAHIRAIAPLTLITMVIGLALTLEPIMDIPAYPYLLAIAVVIWFLQLVKTFIKLWQFKN